MYHRQYSALVMFESLTLEPVCISHRGCVNKQKIQHSWSIQTPPQFTLSSHLNTLPSIPFHVLGSLGVYATGIIYERHSVVATGKKTETSNDAAIPNINLDGPSSDRSMRKKKVSAPLLLLAPSIFAIQGFLTNPSGNWSDWEKNSRGRRLSSEIVWFSWFFNIASFPQCSADKAYSTSLEVLGWRQRQFTPFSNSIPLPFFSIFWQGFSKSEMNVCH